MYGYMYHSTIHGSSGIGNDSSGWNFPKKAVQILWRTRFGVNARGQDKWNLDLRGINLDAKWFLIILKGFHLISMVWGFEWPLKSGHLFFMSWIRYLKVGDNLLIHSQQDMVFIDNVFFWMQPYFASSDSSCEHWSKPCCLPFIRD